MHALPKVCSRGRNDCQPLSNMIADSIEMDFICVGKNDGTTRVHGQDKYRLCKKSQDCDTMYDYDKRDLTDELYIIAKALSVIENMKYNYELGCEQGDAHYSQ